MNTTGLQGLVAKDHNKPKKKNKPINTNMLCLICKADITGAISIHITHQIENSNSKPILTVYQFLQSIGNFKHLDITKVSQHVCEKCCVQIFAFYEFQVQCNKAAGNQQKAEKMKKLSVTKVVVKSYIPEVPDEVLTQNNEKTEYLDESEPEVKMEFEEERILMSDSTDAWYYIPNEADKQPTEEKEEEEYQNRRAACKVCKKIVCMRAMKAHMMIHTYTEPYKCTKCSNCPQTCTVCGESFPNMALLKLHMMSHKLPYSCKVCGRRFRLQRTCESHEMIHADGPKTSETFQCMQCSKVYNCKSRLKTHMFSHGIVRPYECNGCGKRFDRPCRLKSHQSNCPPKKGDTKDVDNASSDDSWGFSASSSNS